MKTYKRSTTSPESIFHTHTHTQTSDSRKSD